MEYIAVAEVLNTHGIKGCLKMRPLTDNIERFDEDICYYLGDKKVKVNIQNYRMYKGFLYIDFEEFNDINEVLGFKKQYLYIDEKDRYELKDGSFYIDDLIGLKAYFNGEYIGDLVDVISIYSNDVYVIKNDEKEFMIPAVKEFIKKIDLENGLIDVVIIEGMWWNL